MGQSAATGQAVCGAHHFVVHGLHLLRKLGPHARHLAGGSALQGRLVPARKHAHPLADAATVVCLLTATRLALTSEAGDLKCRRIKGTQKLQSTTED